MGYHHIIYIQNPDIFRVLYVDKKEKLTIQSPSTALGIFPNFSSNYDEKLPAVFP